MRLLAPITFGLLVAATIGAFALAQWLKTEPLALDKVRITPKDGFTPNGDCRRDRIKIRFRVTERDRGNVQIVDYGEHRPVRTLARNRLLRAYRFITIYWDGRTDSGELAPGGPYRLRVVLLRQDRDLIPGGVIRLHQTAPREPSRCGRDGGG